jgi:hypothetical protein
MKLLCNLLVVIGLSAINGPIVSAEEVRIEVTGVYAKDSNFGESFGSLEEELPIAMSLLIDESHGFYLPAGTPLMDGQPVAIDTLVLPKEAVVSASASLGDIRWSEADLVTLPRSDLGFRPAVLLMGDLQGDSVKAFAIVSSENLGRLSLTHLKCDDGGCMLDDGAWATDSRTGSRGQVGNLSVTVSQRETLVNE